MRKRRGFTLIELVMVIVIIGILAAIAIPRFINLRKQAEQAACDANVGAIRAALANYYARTALSGSPRFPSSLHSASFLPYLMGNTLPRHPGEWPEGEDDYNDLYSPSTGVIRTHVHP